MAEPVIRCLRKINSGGQTGADLVALQVAREFRVPTGGYAPKGWKTEDGPNTELRDVYGLTEHESASYPNRTRANAETSDATFVMCHDVTSYGTQLVVAACIKRDRPCWIVNLETDVPLVQAGLIAGLALVLNRPVVLNVAGNRASGAPPWFEPACRFYLGSVLSLLRTAEAMHAVYRRLLP